MINSEIMTLDDIAKIERGRFSPRPRNDPRYYGGEIPFVQTGDVSRARYYIREYNQTLNKEGLAVSKLFKKNTILMTIAANVGDVAILGFDSACPDSIVAFTPKESINHKWLFQVLKSMKNKFDNLSTQNAQKNLSLEKIKPMKIEVPPIELQEVVAFVLDFWDTTIERTQALIVAKEHQFEWLLKQLIGSKKAIAKLEDLCRLEKGIKYRKHSQELPYLEIGDINTQTKSFCIEKKIKKPVLGAVRVPKNTLLISTVRPTRGAITKTHQDMYVSSAFCRLNIKNDFYFYCVLQESFFNHLKARQSGMTYPTVKDRDILTFKVPLLKEEEQIHITKILNTAKQEIDLLTKLANQYSLQKNGLMQKLLSGELNTRKKEAA